MAEDRYPIRGSQFRTTRYPGFVSRALDTTGNLPPPSGPIATPQFAAPPEGTNAGNVNDGGGSEPDTGPGPNTDIGSLDVGLGGIGLGTGLSDFQGGPVQAGTKAASMVAGALVGGPLGAAVGYGLNALGQYAREKIANRVGRTQDFVVGPPEPVPGFQPEPFNRDVQVEAPGPTDTGQVGDTFDAGPPGPSEAVSGFEAENFGRGVDTGQVADPGPSGNFGEAGIGGPEEEGATSGGDDSNDDTGAGGSSAGSSSSGEGGGGTGAGDSGEDDGGWRQGGIIPDNGDQKFEPVQIQAHENEAVLRPEAVAFLGSDVVLQLNNIAALPPDQRAELANEIAERIMNGGDMGNDSDADADDGTDYQAAGRPGAPSGPSPMMQGNPMPQQMPRQMQQMPQMPQQAPMARQLPPGPILPQGARPVQAPMPFKPRQPMPQGGGLRNIRMAR